MRICLPRSARRGQSPWTTRSPTNAYAAPSATWFGNEIERSFCARSTLLFRMRWKMFEHLLHTLIEIPAVLICIVGKCVAGRASPDSILALGGEQIDHQGADLVRFS